MSWRGVLSGDYTESFHESKNWVDFRDSVERDLNHATNRDWTPAFEEKVKKAYNQFTDDDDLKDKIASRYQGHCRMLARYFIETAEEEGEYHTFTKIEGGHPGALSTIASTLENKDNNYMIFSIYLGEANHEFVGIKYGTQIEILSAWENEYTIQDWAKNKKNCFGLDDFFEILKGIMESTDEAAEFFTPGNVPRQLIPSVPGTVSPRSKFRYKTFTDRKDFDNALTLTPIPNDPDIPGHRACVAERQYYWNSNEPT